LGPQTEGSGILLGGGILLAIAIGIALVSGLGLLVWGRSRRGKGESHRQEPVKDGGIEPVEIHTAEPMAVEDAAAREIGEEESEDRSGGVFNEPGSATAVAEVAALETGETSPVISLEDTPPISSPAQDFPEAGQHTAASPVDVDLTSPLAATNEEESVPKNPENLSGPDDSNTGNSAVVGAMPHSFEARESSEGDEENEPEAVVDSPEQIVTDAGAVDVESIQREGAAELSETDGRVGHPEVVALVERPDEVDGGDGAPAAAEESPARYRAPVLAPGKPRSGKPSKPRATDREQVLEMRIRGISDRHGFCRFQVLGRRPASAPAEMEAHSGRRVIVFSEVADEWYEIPQLSDIAAVIERGITISASGDDNADHRWELRGRDLYVLAGLRGVLGFVSTARLSIGRQQIVLCRESRSAEVERILAEAGCDGLAAHGSEKGAPAGWVFFNPVNPSRSVPQVAGDDILNLVRPVADIEILLEGGLWLWDSSWMAGYPPRVHVVGELPSETRVTIDDEVAEEREGRVYRTTGSELPGTHVVWCAGKSVSYSICEPAAGRERWEAYAFSRGSVCGAAVMHLSNAPEILVSVPTANPVLVGAHPGEIFRCDARPGTVWTGFVPFPVCWALPEDPLHCDRSLRRVVLVTPIRTVRRVVTKTVKKRQLSQVLQWCQAIRDCQRKRLEQLPGDGASKDLWKEYAREAKAVRRTMRRGSFN
jgi:hypothetical protein